MSNDGSILKHVRIYKWLKNMIDTNKFDEGTQLPTEEEIAAMFGYNRMTVRKAMDMLVNDGAIVRNRRTGTFLAQGYRESFNYSLDNIISFQELAEKRKMDASYSVYERRIVEASPAIKEELRLPAKSSVIEVCRIIKANAAPVMLEKSYFPYPEFKGILNMDLDRPAIYQNMINVYNLRLERSRQTLYAGLLDQMEKKLLGYAEAQEVPCIRQQNVIHSTDESPIFVFHASFPGDKFRFTVKSGGYKPELL